MRRTFKGRRPDGYMSGLEARLAKQIAEATGKPVVNKDTDPKEVTGDEATYELRTFSYIKPERKSLYRPDFILPNGIIVEGKGIFDAEDREKQLLVKKTHPHLDIRFVFSRSEAPIYPQSPTTMADWCRKHGFKFADKLIPISWFTEKRITPRHTEKRT